MSREIEKIAEDLFEKIRSRFENLNLGDEKAKSTTDPEKARFFNFDYISSQDRENFGNVTVSIIDENSLKIYFSKNISEKLDNDQREEWYDFLHDLRHFARRNLLTFDTRDITRSNLNIKDLKQVAKSDSTLTRDDVQPVAESRMYGTTRYSFENVGAARIRVVHTESVDPEQRGARARHINAIYVENARGERFRMESNKLSGARAMARHICEGGTPYDDVGKHINSMVQEMTDLGRFVRVMKRRTFEDTTATKMVEAADKYYQGMNRQLNHLKGPKAYRNFVETFEPEAQQLDEVDVNDLRERFVKKIFDDRMMAALPLVNKAYRLQEQSEQLQIQSVRDVIENRLPLRLLANEGMDEYIRALHFANPREIVVRVLEDIAQRAKATPEIADFASHWAANYNTVTEDSNEQIREHQALAVKLATHYLRDLKNLHEELRIKENEIHITDFDTGTDIIEEGTWAVPKTDQDIQELQQLMANPIPVGVDAENATSTLYHLIGDDELFDRLSDFAAASGPKADAREVIKYFLQQSMPGLADKLALGDQEMDQALPAQPPQSPPNPIDATGQVVQPNVTGTTGTNQPVAENDDISRLIKLSGIQSVLVK